MTPNEMIIELRKTQSRRILAEQTGLTQAKIANIEKGRATTPAEAVAITALYEQLSSSSINDIGKPQDRAAEIALNQVVAKTLVEEPPAAPTLQQLYHHHQNQLVDPVTHEKLSNVEEPIDVIAPPAEPTITPRDLSKQDGVRRISNSEIQSFKRCRRQWWLTYVRDLQPNSESVLGPRAIGDRIHRALKMYYVTDPLEQVDPKEALEEVIQEDWLTAKTAFYADGQETVPAEFVVAFNKQLDLERAMIEGYTEWLTETGADSEFQVIGSEEYLEAPFPVVSAGVVRLIGRLDVRVRRIYDNLRLFLDHKTLGEFVTAAKQLPMNEQMKFYMLLEMLARPDEPRVAGAIYNMMRRVKRTGTAKPPFYQRIEVQHNPIEIETFKERTIGVISEMEDVRDILTKTPATHHQVAYPTPTKDCSWQCPFANVCTLFDDGSRVEAALEANYVKADPYGYYAQPASSLQVWVR